MFFLPKMAGSLDTKKNQQSQSIAGFLALAGDEGFEPADSRLKRLYFFKFPWCADSRADF